MIAVLASVVAATAAAGGSALYAAMAPASQLFGKTICRGKNHSQIALTYDDGPNGRETPRLLELLAQRSAKATFFLVGKHVKAQPGIVRDILRQGHAIGNHTFHHANLLWLEPRRIQQELMYCQRAIEDATGHTPAYFRPPFGLRRPAVFNSARGMHLTPVMWTATCYDWKYKSAETVMKFAAKDIEKSGFGSVVLLHDGDFRTMGADRDHTLKATALIVAKYQDQGYKFVSISEMMV
jgi:peptidoglycan/xylan/chitin deacetylase (PgdA/CDA1 family)